MTILWWKLYSKMSFFSSSATSKFCFATPHFSLWDCTGNMCHTETTINLFQETPLQPTSCIFLHTKLNIKMENLPKGTSYQSKTFQAKIIFVWLRLVGVIPYFFNATSFFASPHKTGGCHTIPSHTHHNTHSYSWSTTFVGVPFSSAVKL